MRLFFGLPVDGSVAKRAAELQERLRRVAGKVNWVQPENMHFTLRFLGEVPESEVGRTAEAAADVWEAAPAETIALRGVGAFPNARSPRVIWIGVVAGAALLGRLQEALGEALFARLGLPQDERDFVPHLTLGRVKTPRPDRALEEALTALSAAEVGAFRAETFVLYQSTLKPGGPVYRPVRVYAAPGAPG